MTTNNVLQVSYHKIKERAGNRRLYIEGFRLLDAGFEKGANLDINTDEVGCVVISLSEHKTKNRVSGRTNKASGKIKPVIDINQKEFNDVLGIEEGLSAEIYEGRIVFRIHHEALAKLEREQRCRDEVVQGVITEASLCTGIGVSTAAIHQGLQESGLEPKLAFVCDVEQSYLDIFHQNNPAHKTSAQYHIGTMEELNVSMLPKATFLSFSLPCTGQSPAGKTGGGIKAAEEHKTAATSLFGLMRVIKQTNPAVMLSENVVQAQDSLTYTLLRAELRRTGYHLLEVVMDNSHGGCLEQRKRYWMIAISSGLAKGLTLENIQKPVAIHQTVKDILANGSELKGVTWWENSHFDRELADKKSKGLGFKVNYIPDDATSVNVVRRQYCKHQISSPFPTNGTQHRLFTPEEVARLQRVPESLVKDSVRGKAIEGLGQGVSYYHPLILTSLIGNHLKSIFSQDWIEPATSELISRMDMSAAQIEVLDDKGVEISIPMSINVGETADLFAA